jgi:hypothetical protein
MLLLLKEAFYKRIAAILANDGTSWTFIIPNTPHYGGLWEAVFDTLIFGEFSTDLAEIQACLKSRQLCPLTSDPKDWYVVAPAHFLISVSSGIIPDTDSLHTPTNDLSRFQLLQ